MMNHLNGKEYYEMLVELYGEKKAKKRAKDYLSFNVFHDEEEYVFCGELRKELYTRK